MRFTDGKPFGRSMRALRSGTVARDLLTGISIFVLALGVIGVMSPDAFSAGRSAAVPASSAGTLETGWTSASPLRGMKQASNNPGASVFTGTAAPRLPGSMTGLESFALPAEKAGLRNRSIIGVQPAGRARAGAKAAKVGILAMKPYHRPYLAQSLSFPDRQFAILILAMMFGLISVVVSRFTRHLRRVAAPVAYKDWGIH